MQIAPVHARCSTEVEEYVLTVRVLFFCSYYIKQSPSEKLLVAHVITKVSTFFGARMFIAVFTVECHGNILSVSC